MKDEFFIKRALLLAARAKGRTSPNPMVGALIVKNGKIISEGFHKKAGTPHAEIIAIENAGEKAKGSALYVSLEPCCHKDKRTPPCTQKIISSGIKKVVIAIKDPNPKVSGKGISELKGAGIEVISGVLEEKAEKLNESYIKYITTGMPFVIMKTAMTLDGKIATPDGQSKWITGETSRKMVHRLRSSVDAVMTAIGTVKADDPSLTARIRGGKNPTKIIIDPDLKIAMNANILKSPADTIIVTRVSNNKSNKLELSGTKLIYYQDILELNWLIKILVREGITSILIEGGSSLNSYALRDGIVDKLMVFIAPKIIGGKDSFTPVGGNFFRKLEDAYRIKGFKVRNIGEDILIEGYIQK
ncbi:MAG: riboflavin biosynthesis protein RibD [Nitrospirae bacterium GWC2_42_7]|nr:MAG: riboflavin biosynthesis protein RibD [Nitrospirae bacterium GWC2_42_7]